MSAATHGHDLGDGAAADAAPHSHLLPSASSNNSPAVPRLHITVRPPTAADRASDGDAAEDAGGDRLGDLLHLHHSTFAATGLRRRRSAASTTTTPTSPNAHEPLVDDWLSHKSWDQPSRTSSLLSPAEHNPAIAAMPGATATLPRTRAGSAAGSSLHRATAAGTALVRAVDGDSDEDDVDDEEVVFAMKPGATVPPPSITRALALSTRRALSRLADGAVRILGNEADRVIVVARGDPTLPLIQPADAVSVIGTVAADSSSATMVPPAADPHAASGDLADRATLAGSDSPATFVTANSAPLRPPTPSGSSSKETASPVPVPTSPTEFPTSGFLLAGNEQGARDAAMERAQLLAAPTKAKRLRRRRVLALAGRSLFIFPASHPLRQWCAHFVTSKYTKLFIVVCIMIHWLLMALRSWSKGEAKEFTLFTSPYETALIPVFAIYNLDIILKVIAFGGFILPTAGVAADGSAIVPDLDEPYVIRDDRREDDAIDAEQREQDALEVVAEAFDASRHRAASSASAMSKGSRVDLYGLSPLPPQPLSRRASGVSRHPDIEHAGPKPTIDEALHAAAEKLQSHRGGDHMSTVAGTVPGTVLGVPTPTGRFIASKPHLRSISSVLDLVAVLAFWAYCICGAAGWTPLLWLLRGLTAVRPFRLLAVTRGTRMILASLKASRRLLRNVAVFAAFFFVVFGIAGVLTFKASYQRQCVLDGSPVSPTMYCGATQLENGTVVPPAYPPGVDAPPTMSMAASLALTKGFACPFPTECWYDQPNPENGRAAFDNIGSTLLLQLQIAAGENWGPLMFGLMASESEASALYCVVIIVVLGYLILQLFVSVTTETFGAVREVYLEEKARAREDKERARQKRLLDEANGGVLPRRADSPTAAIAAKLAETAVGSRVLSLADTHLPAARRVATAIDESLAWRTIFFLALCVYTVLISMVAGIDNEDVKIRKIREWWALEIGFTLVFAFEVVLHLLTAKSARQFIREYPWDTLLATATVIMLALPFNRYLSGFQCFRVYKLVTYLPPVKKLLVKTKQFIGISAVIEFMAVGLGCLATMAMQLFGGVYESGSSGSAWTTFDDLGSAWLSLFALLTGDNWTNYLWRGMDAHGDVPFFGSFLSALWMVTAFTVQNLVLLNLLVAVLLDVLQIDDDEKRERQVAMVDGIPRKHQETSRAAAVRRLFGQVTGVITQAAEVIVRRVDGTPIDSRQQRTRQQRDQDAAPQQAPPGGYALDENMVENSDAASAVGRRPSYSSQAPNLYYASRQFNASDSYLSRRAPKFSSLAYGIDPDDPIRQVEVPASSGINEIAMPSPLLLQKGSLDGTDAAAAAGKSPGNSRRGSTASGLKQRSTAESSPAASSAALHESHGHVEHAAPPAVPFRDRIMKIVESQWFSVATFLAILFSIVTAALDTPEYRLERLRDKDSVTWDLYFTGDVVATVAFALEFALKIVGMRADYFREGWNILDFIVLVTMVASYGADEATSHVLRMSRSLRPLKTIVYLPGVQSIFAALALGMPRILSAIAFSMLILFPYALYGMFLFAGRLRRCNDTGVKTRAECAGMFVHPDSGQWVPRTWDNAYTAFNWDSMGNSLLTLFVMASGEGWTDLMAMTQAIRGPDLQPADGPRADDLPAASWWHALYSVSFMFIGSLATLQLFISIIIQSLDEATGAAYLTGPQRAWLTACKRISSLRARPLHQAPEKRSKLGRAVGTFLLKHGDRLNTFVTATMTVHVLMMCVEHAGQPLWLDQIREVGLQALVFVYFGQMCLLMAARGPLHYFKKSYWNGYDFFITSTGVLFVILQLFIDNPIFTRLQKTLLIGYALRLARRVSGLHTLFKTMRASAKDLMRIFYVLAIVLLFFSLVATELFGLTRYNNAYSGYGSVRSTWLALLAMFRLTTGDDWPNTMDALRVSSPMCVTGAGYMGSDCGSPVWAIVFFIIFFIVTTYVVLNLVVALLTSNFDYVFSSDHLIISDDALRSFQLAWATLDPLGTGKIKASQVALLLHRSTLQKIDSELAEDRRWRSNLLYYDLNAQCNANGQLGFQTALMTLCLHVIPLEDCLTYHQYKARVQYLRSISSQIARERLVGLFRMAVERRRFVRLVHAAVRQHREDAAAAKAAADTESEAARVVIE
ncbi:calcium channel protein [Blastocladiella emersonii ATCC 22665]|nr:calcium channel protein [Blastocladiella emersonii ATCC 22665]